MSKEPTCQFCEFSKELQKAGGPITAGRFSMQCLGCCVRLVLSTHPDKAQAKAMLKAIELSGVTPSRADVLAHVGAALKLEAEP